MNIDCTWRATWLTDVCFVSAMRSGVTTIDSRGSIFRAARHDAHRNCVFFNCVHSEDAGEFIVSLYIDVRRRVLFVGTAVDVPIKHHVGKTDVVTEIFFWREGG